MPGPVSSTSRRTVAPAARTRTVSTPLAVLLDHRLVGVLHEVQHDLLDLILVRPHRRATTRSPSSIADLIVHELIADELDHAADLIGQRARAPLRRVVTREQQEVLHDARGPRGLVGHDLHAAPARAGVTSA